jgi:hypothetical protein
MGVKAQEVEKVFPEIVSHGAEGFLSVSYNYLVAGVIEAVKEFYYKWLGDSKAIHREIASKANQSEVQQLEAENAKLKQENATIKARLDKIEKMLIKK